jgi:hypothetical protein
LLPSKKTLTTHRKTTKRQTDRQTENLNTEIHKKHINATRKLPRLTENFGTKKPGKEIDS